MPDDIVAAQFRKAEPLPTIYRDVATFNDSILGLRAPEAPTVLNESRLGWAVSAFEEEIQEFVEATQRGDVVEAADGLMDLITFAMGRLVEMGVPVLPVHMGVHAANMGKVRGELSKRPGSQGYDAIKPAGWTAPDHSWLLGMRPSDFAMLQRRIEVRRRAQFRVLLLGHARHGKDTVAEMLRDHYGYRFTSSSLWAAERVMLPAFARYGIHYPSAQACFEDRGNHRAFWFEQITAYNTPNKAAVARAIYAENDLYCGMRNADEFIATMRAIHPQPVVIWVDASGRGLPPEDPSSCTVTRHMADYVLSNNGTLEDLRRELDRLMDHLLGLN